MKFKESQTVDESKNLSYKDVLCRIEEKENHLLIGNGFNQGLGVDTSYWHIFEVMKEDNSIYSGIETKFRECDGDIEALIDCLQGDINSENIFLRSFVQNRIKFDFMAALQKIVSKEIKQVYKEKNAGIYLLLSHFSNYFTLNYDSFLYLLLLRFKAPFAQSESNPQRSLALFPNTKYVENSLNETQNQIYSKIKSIRRMGEETLTFSENESSTIPLSEVRKVDFVKAVKKYKKLNNLDWRAKDIERVCGCILEEERNDKKLLRIDDGGRSKPLPGMSKDLIEIDIKSVTQNLFFIHGAFHILVKGEKRYKVTQETEKALYTKLQDLLNQEGNDVLCVFQADNKIEAIEKDPYLSHCLDKLSELRGALVILGCSLSDNDSHIFDRINQSQIKDIYISYYKKCEETYVRGISLFPGKNVYVFDAETISYNIEDFEQEHA